MGRLVLLQKLPERALVARRVPKVQVPKAKPKAPRSSEKGKAKRVVNPKVRERPPKARHVCASEAARCYTGAGEMCFQVCVAQVAPGKHWQTSQVDEGRLLHVVQGAGTQVMTCSVGGTRGPLPFRTEVAEMLCQGRRPW